MEEGFQKQAAQPTHDTACVNAQDVVCYAIPVAEPAAVGISPAPDAIVTGGWAADLCGCCTHCVPNCYMAFFCPCVSLAQISARLGIASFACTLVSLLFLFSVSGGVASIGMFLWIWHARATTRERFRIPGDCLSDCCVSFWCPNCTLAQVATHIKSYKPGTCSFGPPDTLAAYQ